MRRTKRHHSLFVGEKVFCADENMCWAEVSSMSGTKATVRTLTGDTITTDRYNLYQIAKGKVCKRVRTAVCYEHDLYMLASGYKYYCPALNEELFESEVCTE